MNEELFRGTMLWKVAVGPAAGAAGIVASAIWAFAAPADDAAGAVAAVAVAIASAGLGLAAVALYLGAARRAVRRRAHALLRGYLPEPSGRASAAADADAVMTATTLVSRQLEQFATTARRPVRRARSRKHMVGATS